jgi:HK97 family phage major capsid protein
MNLKEINEAIVGKSKILHDIFEEAGSDMDMSKVKSLSGDSSAKVEAIKAMNLELDTLGKKREEFHALQKARKEADEAVKAGDSPIKNDPAPQAKSLGGMIMESKAVKNHGTPVNLDVDLKALFQSSAGWDPEALRIGRVIDYPVRKLQVSDYLPIIPTQQDTIRFMLESTFTNNAAEAAAGDAAGEAALALTETSDEVEKIAVFIPVTEEQLEDVPAAEAYLNNRLGYMVRARLDSQILNGDGSTPNLKGTLNIGGSLQTQAKGSDPTPDAIYKAFDLLRTVGFCEPSVLFVNPTDWQDVRLLRTADGIYIFGSPLDPGIDRIWGVPVCQTTAVVVNTMIAGDYAQFSALYLKRGITIEMSNGYSDYFVKGKFAVKATMRCAVVHYRTGAFVKVTGV